MSAAIVQKTPTNTNNNENGLPKMKIDSKSNQPAKKAQKKSNGSSPANNGPAKQTNGTPPNIKPKEASSPHKSCIAIAAKPSPNTQQIQIAQKPLAAKPLSPTPTKTPSSTKQPPKPIATQQPVQQAPINQPQQQQQQPRIIFNGSLQSILAAVGSNPQNMTSQQFAQQLAAVGAKSQTTPLPNNNPAMQQFYQSMTNAPKPIQNAPIKSNNNNQTTYHQNGVTNAEAAAPHPHAPPTIFTATTTPDGQIVFQTGNPGQPQPQPNQLQLQQHLMQQNILNMMHQQNQVKNPSLVNQQNPIQHPLYFGQNQYNQMFQQNMLHQQQQQQHQQQQTQHHQQQQQNMVLTPQLQPMAASTPTPQDEIMLRQKLLQEEQKFQQLQQQLKNKQDPIVNGSNSVNSRLTVAIKPKQETPPAGMNVSLPNEKMDLSEDNCGSDMNANLNTSDPNGKTRGRPRLYVKNPLTGKSIKGKRLDGSTILKVAKPNKTSKVLVPSASKKLLIKSLNKKAPSKDQTTSNTNGVFPSPSTSISSSHSIAPLLPQDTIESAIVDNGEILSSNTGVSSSPSSSFEADTDTSGDDQAKDQLPPALTQPIDQPKILTHVIEGFLVKESSKPFQQPNATEPVTTTSFTCDECKATERKDQQDGSFCSEMCKKRNAKKLKRQSKKEQKLKSLKENTEAKTKESPSPVKNSSLLEDTTNNLETTCNKSKCKSKSHHHSHKHRHRRHHGNSSSSCSSRDKIKKRLKIPVNASSMNPETLGEKLPAAMPPIQAFSTTQTVSVSPQRMTYQPVAAAAQFSTNTFNSTLLNNSYSSATAGDSQLPQGDPTEWNCDEVFEFVRVVAGVNVAQVFKVQEVDGSALSLIRDDHLVNTMQIKLGPALKIMSKFNELKTKSMNRVF